MQQALSLDDEQQPKKALVVLSGGQDSTTCLFFALAEGYTVHAVTFDYGQRHGRELVSATIIAKLAVVSHEIIRLGPILESTSPLVSTAKLAQYVDHASLPGGLEDTFIPMRNQILLSMS